MSDKKEALFANRPRNLHSRRVLPGQGAEPRKERSRARPLTEANRKVRVHSLQAVNTVLASWALSLVVKESHTALRTRLICSSSYMMSVYWLHSASATESGVRWARGRVRYCGMGHAVLAINGMDVNGKYTADGKEVLEYLSNPTNYPVSIRFGRPRLTSNEKLMLASMFHSLFAIGSQLSPEQGSSGIEILETDTFKLHCFQTLTGIKFVVLADPRQAGIDSLLRKIYEIYSDFALKNPFYSLEMPIRCELFDQNLKLALEVAEKAGTFGPGS